MQLTYSLELPVLQALHALVVQGKAILTPQRQQVEQALYQALGMLSKTDDQDNHTKNSLENG